MHRLGAALMWGGVAVAIIATLVGGATTPVLTLGVVAAAAVCSLVGAYLKKRYCPKCRSADRR
ncbi:MAG: hypothetical protein KDA32_05110 [Phycisphaerales bacterium]|nr:hypothetical protein [Phycisphaerales bacterium]